MVRRLGAALLLMAIACRAVPEPVEGARIEKVGAFTPPAIAGLQAGDVVVSWDRAPVTTPFDLLELEMVQAPRGPVTLGVQRGAKSTTVTIPIGEWKLTTRSVLSAEAEQLDLRARKAVVDARWPEAATDFERLAAALTRDRPRDAAWAFVQLGIAQSRAKQIPASDKAFEQARGLARSVKDPVLEGHVLDALGDERTVRSDVKQAQVAFEAALQIREAAAPDGLAVAASKARLANLKRMHGDFAAASDSWKQVIAIRERLAPRSIELGMAITGLGSQLLQRGEDRPAEKLYEQALKLREPWVPVGADNSGLFGNLGLIAKNRGDLVKAEELYRKSLALVERVDPTAYEVAFPLNFLGNLARMKGELALADRYHQRALEIFQKQRPGGVAVAGCLNNLGINAGRQGDWARAETLHRQALELREKLAPESLDVAASLNSLGAVALERKDLIAAEPLLQRALALKQKAAPGTLIVSTTLFTLGDLEVARGSHEKALEQHRAALAIRSKLAPGTTDEANSLYAVGKALRQLGQKEDAIAHWVEAIAAVEAQRGRLKDPDDRSGFASLFSELYRDQLDLLVEVGRTTDAFDLLERSRAHALLTMLAQREVGYGSELPPELLVEQRQLDAEYDKAQSALGKLDPNKQEAEIDKRVGVLAELTAKRSKLLERISQAAPRVAALTQPQPLVLAQAQKALDPGTALLAYSVGRERTLLFVVTSAGLSVFPISVTAKALQARVLAFRGLIERGRTQGAPEAALRVQGERLFTDLVGPALGLLENEQRLLISADGPLYVLPFAALVRTHEPLEYVAEWKPVHSVASLTVYTELRKHRREAAASTPLVAFGDPAYAGRYPQLPKTRDEVTMLAALFGSTSVTRLGSAATEAEAIATGTTARILHFATHGVLDRRLPLDSALVLTASDGDNGLLQAWEIIEKVRIDADLVTLSGCETGLGRELGGEGIVGLTRAFQHAGARSVVMSLWSVSDHSTAELMQAFYAALAVGKTKDVALATAQRGLIHSDKWRQPFHWAAFELTGDWK